MQSYATPVTHSKVSPATWGLLITAVMLTAIGQLFMKVSTQYLTTWAQFTDQLLIWQLAPAEQSMLIWFVLGVSSYFGSMILWMYVLSFLKLSRAYPLLSFAYVLVYLGAVFWPKIGESFSLEKSVGVFIIILGVIIVSIPSKKPLK
ncbi:4-amino-4-deoxy-L-arabinose-phospho-UDP flippase [Leucothrix arctica]|uniref:4-amino-4-deoxy-L-arabinose-phospho-UDP flippase n=1 Tax=Leucothrix arctica TaxID=1481894 RepID=A0A317CHV8_9GAMM|nr:4-amino-4-deoxy-L-arabinose-phospho-UDP flippase [Leucothrix arctica]PWQ96993.1 4-amino-4-deoxy-L-arabinose-phospho-UDP flippase [Leucothrix arctica]